MRDKAGQTVGREGISAQTGCISPAPSFLTFPTAFPTGYTASCGMQIKSHPKLRQFSGLF